MGMQLEWVDLTKLKLNLTFGQSFLTLKGVYIKFFQPILVSVRLRLKFRQSKSNLNLI